MPLQTRSSTRAPTVHPAAPSISAGSALWPENNTSEELWSVSSPNTTALAPIPKPTTGVSTTIRCSTIGCSTSAGRRMAAPSTTAAKPIPTAHRSSETVGVVNAGMLGTANENVP